jgi:hypothetical protein
MIRLLLGAGLWAIAVLWVIAVVHKITGGPQ